MDYKVNKEKIMDQVSLAYDEIEYGEITIEKRGLEKPADVVSKKRTRFNPEHEKNAPEDGEFRKG